MDSAIQLTKLRLDGGTQPRVKIDTDVVDDYAERIKAGDEFPPVVVFHDGVAHWLAEGFHRYHAHAKAGKKTIRCDIRKGTVRDAILFSCGANSSHGLQRTTKDKQRAIETLLNDSEWSKYSNVKIAGICCVSDKTVAASRDRLNLGNSEVAKRIGADGKLRPATQPKRKEPTNERSVAPVRTEPGSADFDRGVEPDVDDTLDDDEPEDPTEVVREPARPAKAKPKESNVIGDSIRQVTMELEFATDGLADFQVQAIYEGVRLWMAADLEKRGLKP